ncbi:solute carrier organic anion transporter family member 4A1-like [Branchiostoma floridae x Branchiostoma japonicum]
MSGTLPDIRQEAPSGEERPLPDDAKHGKEGEEEEEGRCGLFGFSPDWLQVFNSPRCLLFFMCCLCATETAILLGLTPGVITTIEGRFKLSSTQSGFIISSTELFAVFTVPIISYFGAKSHKGRWLGAGAVCVGLGSTVFALPHFLAGRYVPSGGTNISESSSAICHPSSNGTADEQQCDTNGGYSQLENYLYVFVLATFLMSFLVGPLYTLGVAYLDENVSKKVSGGYVGILYASTAIGPAVGYVMSSQLLNQYVNWPEVTNLTPNDQQWLGNWWFGFFPLSIVAFLVAIPVFCFPRKLAGISKRPEETKEEANIPTSKDDKDGALEEDDDDDEPTNPFSCGAQDFKDFWSTVKDLGSNFSYMSVCLAGCTEAMVLSGALTFGPKLGETQLGLSPSDSSLYLGLLMIPAGAVGNLFGGWLAKKAGADCKKLIKLILIVSAASLLGHCVFLLYCTTPGSTTYLATNSTSCATRCGCADSLYDPICDVSGIEYQSGCHAGCTSINKTGSTTTYSNCSCIMKLSANVTSVSGSEAIHGPCPGGCPGYVVPVFLTVFVLLSMMAAASMAPYTATIMRLVSKPRRSFALGVQWTLFRLLAWIPGPVLFGYIIDQACVLWQEECGVVGACVVYDSGKLGLYLLVSSVSIRLVSMALYLLAYCLYKPVAEEKAKATHGDQTMI